jgi:subtilisin family serine protease
MIRVGTIWRPRFLPAMVSFLSALLTVGWGVAPALAQNMMRSPSINMSSRIPRIDPNIAGRAVTGLAIDTIRNRPACTAADRDGNGNCIERTGNGNNGHKNKVSTGVVKGNTLQASVSSRTIAKEIVAEIDGTLSEAQVDALARRHGLRRVQSQSFELIGATIGLFRITGNKTMEAASREFAQEGGVRAIQPNFRYVLQDQKASASDGDAAQYARLKLRLAEAHAIADGANVTVAVIDSGVDLRHPEFAGVAITPFDVLDNGEGPHAHGTGVTGAIVAHVQLTGSAPAAHILAIRAFGASGKGGESTSYAILRGFDFAASHGAQIVNMSFAGPKDAVIGRGLAALAARNIVTVAAAGNAGAKSPPLYPAADASVIAVSATDAQDKLFAASNRGSYIALSAPGGDLLLPAPDDKYQIASGTSFSSAYVSGLAALVLARNPTLKPHEVRAVLMKTARDLGPPGPDDQFGAGEADAFAAVSAVAAASMPVAAAEKPAGQISDAPKEQPSPTRDISAPTMAADKPPGSETRPDISQTRP